jgi:hypothetical protein
MSLLQALLAALRKLDLRSFLARFSSRWLFVLFSAVSRVLQRRSSDKPVGSADGSQKTHVAPGGSSSTVRQNALPVTYFSPSFMPTALHPYRYHGPSASRSSQDIGTMPIQDSYLLRNLSVHDLRTRSPSPDTRSPSPIHPREESIHTSEIVAMLPTQLLSEAGRLSPGIPEAVEDGRYSKQVFM